MSEVEEAFKFWIEVYGFSDSHKFEKHWNQIYEINSYWNKMLDSFDTAQFKSSLEKYCLKMSNTGQCEYNLDELFNKAKLEWRIELMTNVANEIAHMFIPSSSLKSRIVKWNGSMMVIDWRQV